MLRLGILKRGSEEMRPIETLMLLANLLTFFTLTVPQFGAAPWMGYSALIALPIAGVQVLVEGPRWQMVPAYALTGSLFLVWLLQTIAPLSRPAGRGWTRWLAAGLVIGLGVLG
jgi:hypothetical protein